MKQLQFLTVTRTKDVPPVVVSKSRPDPFISNTLALDALSDDDPSWKAIETLSVDDPLEEEPWLLQPFDYEPGMLYDSSKFWLLQRSSKIWLLHGDLKIWLLHEQLLQRSPRLWILHGPHSESMAGIASMPITREI